MAGLVSLLVFWVLAGACQRHGGVGGFLLHNTTTTKNTNKAPSEYPRPPAVATRRAAQVPALVFSSGTPCQMNFPSPDVPFLVIFAAHFRARRADAAAVETPPPELSPAAPPAITAAALGEPKMPAMLRQGMTATKETAESCSQAGGGAKPVVSSVSSPSRHHVYNHGCCSASRAASRSDGSRSWGAGEQGELRLDVALMPSVIPYSALSAPPVAEDGHRHGPRSRAAA